MLRRQLSIYGAFARNAFLSMLAYRMRYFTGIFTYMLFVAVHYFIWLAVFDNQPEGATINGFTLTQMITYVTVGWIARTAYFTDIDYEIDELVKTGEISVYLLRPVNFQLMIIAKAVGQSLYRVSLFTIPVGAVLLIIFPVSPPENINDLLMFFLATFVGFLILVEINFIVGLLAFSFKSITGLIRAKYFLVQLASGLLLPLVFFPDWLRVPLELLPFQTIAYIPLRFYLGKIDQTEIASVLLFQLFWIVVLLILGKIVWERALVKLTLQGG